MSRFEVMCTRYGEMLDLINCRAIAEGMAKPKKEKKKWTYDEAMALR